MSEQLCTFSLDGLLFGIPVADVQEVIRFQQLTPVPLVTNAVRGLINLRGQIVTAIDPRDRLGLPRRADDARPMNVVVHTTIGPVSLLVDEIGDVVDVPPGLFEPPPEMLDAAIRELVKGAHKLPGRLLLVLDTAGLIEAEAA
jgi:purine-binding chemotaxis protein CheW